jgi:hypothetical protein
VLDNVIFVDCFLDQFVGGILKLKQSFILHLFELSNDLGPFFFQFFFLSRKSTTAFSIFSDANSWKVTAGTSNCIRFTQTWSFFHRREWQIMIQRRLNSLVRGQGFWRLRHVLFLNLSFVLFPCGHFIFSLIIILAETVPSLVYFLRFSWLWARFRSRKRSFVSLTFSRKTNSRISSVTRFIAFMARNWTFRPLWASRGSNSMIVIHRITSFCGGWVFISFNGNRL